jgi:hypothetical protein
MAFGNINYPGAQPINETSTTQRHPLGTVVKAVDPDKGEAEFVYMKGVAATVVGSLVEVNGDFSTTVAGAASKGPVAVAMSANVANQYGWYAVRGRVPTVAAAGGANAAAYLSAGGVTNVVTALQGINGMKILAAPSGGLSDCVLFYPSAAGYAAS